MVALQHEDAHLLVLETSLSQDGQHDEGLKFQALECFGIVLCIHKVMNRFYRTG